MPRERRARPPCADARLLGRLDALEQAELPRAGLVGSPSSSAALDGRGQLRAQRLGREVHAGPGVRSRARDEEARPFVGHAELAQLRLAQTRRAPSPHDRARSPHSDARHAQQRLERGRVHFHGKEVQVVDGPVRLRIEVEVEEGVLLVDDLGDVEAIEAQQPVGLVEPVLAVELDGVGAGKARVVVHGRVGAEEHPFERERAVERRRQVEYLEVALGRGSHDHLRGLTGRHERALFARGPPLRQVGGVPAHDRARVAVLGDAVAYLAHGRHDALLVLLGGEQGEASLGGQLHVHAHAVGQVPERFDELGRGSGNGFRVDVAAKAVLVAQQGERAHHELGGVVGVADDPGAEEQPLDVVAAVERDGELRQLARRERCARHLVRGSVHAVGAVVHAHVGHEHLEQRDAASVGREAVAAAGGHGVAQLALLR